MDLRDLFVSDEPAEMFWEAVMYLFGIWLAIYTVYKAVTMGLSDLWTFVVTNPITAPLAELLPGVAG